LTVGAAASVGAALSAVSLLDPQAASANDATARTEANFTPFNTEGSSHFDSATFAPPRKVYVAGVFSAHQPPINPKV
jgi:hypothetical protein